MSLTHLCSPEVSRAIMALPDPVVDIEEEELEKIHPNPTPTVNQLRRMFWLEYDRAVDNHMQMDMSRVYVGVCSRAGFYKIVQNPHQLAWLVCPPREYEIETEELLGIGLKQIRAILQLPLKNHMGFIDTKLAEVQLKAVMMLDMRRKGAYLQRSVQANYNVNENRASLDSADATLIGDLDSQIKKLSEDIAQIESKKPSISPTLHLEQLQKHAVKPATNREEQEAIEAEFKHK